MQPIPSPSSTTTAHSIGVTADPLLLLLLLWWHLLLHASHATSHPSHHPSRGRAPRGRPGLLNAEHPCISAIALPCCGTVPWAWISAIALSWGCAVSLPAVIDVGIRGWCKHR